ncbi:TadE-like protein [Thalassoglobus neptunius]|uniref:TadE-like protein n=1 Tax=Thalassoglobus neptunius TaxID=1938619 RepID=A0A5C5WNB3_9PLAN|nr:TadE/TadG family type IV pilus assembly protein [Thalassoglobus neptunius]TWT52090.1 TadE-like protein [Thalassoglobus neptunius]
MRVSLKRFKSACQSNRRAVATVEFAIVAPIFMSIALGVMEMGRALDVSTNLTSAVREAGRFAAMHRNGIVPPGTTTNQKVIQDIRNVLKANGVNGDAATITITHAEGPNQGQTFDLDSSANYMQYFNINISIAYQEVSGFPLKFMHGQSLRSSIIFRLGLK